MQAELSRRTSVQRRDDAARLTLDAAKVRERHMSETQCGEDDNAQIVRALRLTRPCGYRRNHDVSRRTDTEPRIAC